MAIDLYWLSKYVERNPYTGSVTVDFDAVMASPELRELLANAWGAGYSCGFSDADGDKLVSESSRNPYLR